jgi:hypothetical protein
MLTASNGGFLAGLLAGDGSFSICEHNGGQSWVCRCRIALRSDDAPLLQQFQALTGLGSVYAMPARSTSKPQTVWRIQRRRECVCLASQLQGHPVLNKKAGDIAVWAAAVDVWADRTIDPSRRRARMKELSFRLKARRSMSVWSNVPRLDISPRHVAAFLAGFATAEGHFGASASGHPIFRINLRQDDEPILTFLRRFYGLGWVDFRMPTPNASARASWHVNRLDEVARLVSLFDREPPRGRKAAAYGVWREIVLDAARTAGRRRTVPERERRQRLVQTLRSTRTYIDDPPIPPSRRLDERRLRCRAALRAWAELVGHESLTAPSYAEIRAAAHPDWPDRNTVARTFGGWREALKACGLSTKRSFDTRRIARSKQASGARRRAHDSTQRNVIAAAVSRCRNELGRWPRAMEFFRWRLHNAPDSPSQGTVYRVFPGGWREVIAEAFGADPS